MTLHSLGGYLIRSAILSGTLMAQMAQMTAQSPPPLACKANASGIPAWVRPSGAERPSDITLTCSGGAQPPIDAAIPQVDVNITFGIDSGIRLDLADSHEILLLIDEPGAGLPATPPGFGPDAPISVCPTPLQGCMEYVSQAPGSTIPVATDTRQGTSATTPGKNLFKGVISGNSVTFYGVPMLAPGITGLRVFRIANIRVDPSALDSLPSVGGAKVEAFIQVTGFTSLSISNARLILASIAPSASVLDSGFPSAKGCPSPSSAGAATILSFPGDFGGFLETPIPGWNDTLDSGQPSKPTPPNTTAPVYASEFRTEVPAGTRPVADSGIRVKAVFAGIRPGVHLYVTATNLHTSGMQVLLPDVRDSRPADAYVSPFAQLTDSTTDLLSPVAATGSVSTSSNSAYRVPVAEIPVVNGVATAVWKVVHVSPNATAALKFGVYYHYTTSPVPVLPFTGSAAATLTYSAIAPDKLPSQNDLFISLCPAASGAPAVTATALTAAPTGIPNTYTMTATVTSSAGIPAGTVAFYDSGDPFQWLFPLDSNGVATITHNFFGGMHSFTAVFTPGNNLFAPSTSSPLSLLIPAPPTATVLSVSPGGGSNQYILTATVNFVKPGGISGTPFGRVTFYDNGVPLVGGNAPVLGTNTATASVVISSGGHSLTAVFTPNQTYGAEPSTSPSVPLTVPATPTSTVLSAIPGNALNQYSLMVTVSANIGTPAGTVTCYDNGAALPGGFTILTPNGMAALFVSLSPGNHSITARYTPTDPSLFVSSASSILQLAVPAITSTTLRATANAAGQYTLVAAVATLSPSTTGGPIGSVTFLDNGSALPGGTSALNFSGTASYVATLVPGTHSLTATFNSANSQFFTSSTSPGLSVVVNRAAPSINVTSSPNPSLPGQSVKFTASLTGHTGTASGTVRFVDGGQSLGTVALVSDRATISATLVTTGTHDILVSYSGDTFNSDALTRFGQVVDRMTSSLSLTADRSTINFGQVVTFTAAVTPPPPAGAAAPSGTVQFLEGSTLIGTSTVISGGATLALSHLAPGPHAIFAYYSGDANWNGVRSSTVDVNINVSGTATLLTASATISAVTLTAAIVPTVSVGSVQFFDSTTAKVLDNVKPVNGAASLVLTPAGAAALGGHTILAEYSGGGEYNGSNSSPLVMLALRNSAGGTSLSLAPDEWVSFYGSKLADVVQPVVESTLSQVLGGFSVNVTDSSGAVLSATLSYVSQSQINFLMPSKLAPGTALVTLMSSGNVVAAVPVPTAPVAPGLFSAFQVVTSPVGDVYLILYGTGIRNRTNIGQVTCLANGTSIPVMYAGAQPSFEGLDQINIQLPSGLSTSGTLSVSLMVNGEESNAISVVLQ